MTKTYTDLVGRRSSNAISDECYTPSDQVLPLLEYLNKDNTYYEATSGKSNLIVDGFNKNGYKIVPSNDKDFFDCGPCLLYTSPSPRDRG